MDYLTATYINLCRLIISPGGISGCLLVFFLWSDTATLSAQVDLQIHKFSEDDGLSNNYIRCLLQDHLGFIWIGTENGLNRFDGRQFLEFRHDVEDEESIDGNWINTLFEDQRHNLWVSTRFGLNRLDRTTGKFERIKLITKDRASSSYSITKLFEDRSQQIWATTQQMGVLRLKADGSNTAYHLEQLSVAPTDADIKTNLQTFDIIQDKAGDLWVFTQIGLDRISTGKNRLDRFLFPQHEENPRFVDGGRTKLVIDAEGNILVAAINLNLFFINPSDPQPQLRPIQGYSQAFRSLHPETFKGRLCILPNREHLLWLSRGKTVGQLNLQTGAFHHINQNPDQFSLVVSSLMQDSGGNLWIGSSGAGLYLGVPTKTPFQFYAHRPGDPTSISRGMVRTMLEDNAGHLWVGFLGNGLDEFRYDEQHELVKIQNVQKTSGNAPGLVGNHIIKLMKDRQGQIWIGSNNGTGMNQFNPQAGSWKVFKHEPENPNSIAAGGIWGLDEDRKGNIWIGSFTDGLTRLHPPTNSMKHFVHDPDNANSLSNDLVKCLTIDREGIIWIGTNRGLNRLDPETENFTHYFNDPLDTQSITAGVIWSIYEDRQKDLWIGTGMGLNRFDREDQVFERFYENDGLPSNTVYGTLEDKEGNLWVSTDNGLAKRLSEGGKYLFQPLKKEDGIGSNAFLPKASFLSEQSGKLFFGSVDGMLVIDPNLLQRANSTIPKLVLHDVTKFNLKAKGGEEIVDHFISSGNGEVKLTHRDQSVTFTLSALDAYSSKSTNYEYLLEGFNPQWMKLQDNLEMTFTNLRPGQYTLKARSVNVNNVASPPVQLLVVTVYPPWWRSWWAYLFMALAVGGLLYTLYRFQLKRQLEIKETENLRALDVLKNKLYTNITHEFRTPLTVINGMADQIAGQEKIKRLIKNNSADLINLVNQIMELRKLEMGKMQLSYIQADVVLFLQNIVESYRVLAGQKDIQLHFIPKTRELWMDLDQEKLLRILSNLLSNAIKFTPNGGKVYLEIEISMVTDENRQEQEVLKISVIDTGIGIAGEKQPFIFERFYQVAQPSGSANTEQRTADEYHFRGPGSGSGVGLALTKDLVILMGGQISLESVPGKGSTFTVLLPVRREAQRVDIGKSSELAIAVPRPHSVHPKESVAPVGNDKKPNLLIIEDNVDVVEYLESLLEEQYNLLIARDGEEGIAIAFDQIPDLILSDVMMPGKDGLEVCSMLKQDERTSHIPIVLLTAKTSVESRIEGLERGADAYLAKPFNQQELFIRLQKLNELRQRLRQRFQNLDARLSTEPEAEDFIFQQQDAFLTKLRQEVEQNMEDPGFGTAQLCRKVGMSRSHLHLKITALTGRSTSNFIRTLRLQKARELLENTQMNVSEVTLEVGMNDRSYFSRKFKEEFGLSPSALIAKRPL